MAASDQYRHQAEQGSLASVGCTPHIHGSAPPQPIIDAVRRAKAQDQLIETGVTRRRARARPQAPASCRLAERCAVV